MSSHHIVREKQEPALYIQSLAGFEQEHLGQLLEWCPVVMVDGREYDRVHSYGIKIDAVVAADVPKGLQAHTSTINANGDSFCAAMNYLVANEHSAVNVIAERFDLPGALKFAGKISLVILCGQRKIYPIKRGFTKWFAGGESLHLHQQIALLAHVNLEKRDALEYRVIKDGFIRLDFQQPLLFISESLD